ncbi:MAG: helix-turn-helix transcriptional regulator [Bacteroidia bacterium]|nr:helix-turn-helix transcriptional regulator [Bacteroidia bacterium]
MSQKLTQRQKQVLRLALRGLSYMDIAYQLHITPRYVRHHFRNACDRMGFKEDYQLVLWFYRVLQKKQL